MDTPYLSIVVVGRNDDYGGNFIRRLQVFFQTTIYLCNSTGLESEVIVVEWNPPPQKPRLRDVLETDSFNYRGSTCIRFIEVPSTIHQSIPNPNNVPLFEYLGKNTGIRRAQGTFILVTNPDIIFTPGLIEYIRQYNLHSQYFYRADRYDISLPSHDYRDIAQLLDFCKTSVVKIHRSLESTEPFRSRSLQRLLWLIGVKVAWMWRIRRLCVPHTNGAGDFILAHKVIWHRLRGFPEMETHGLSSGIDGLMVYLMIMAGVRQKVLPFRIYHQAHERREKTKQPSVAVLKAIEDVLRQRRFIMFNNESWGLGAISLPEIVI